VKANQGSPGVDAETIEAIEAGGVEAFLAQLQAERAWQARALTSSQIRPTASSGERRAPPRRGSCTQMPMYIMVFPPS
jgi:hypothetical protein